MTRNTRIYAEDLAWVSARAKCYGITVPDEIANMVKALKRIAEQQTFKAASQMRIQKKCAA